MGSDKLAGGLTLYYYQKKTHWILNQIIKTNTGGSEWTNEYYQTEEWGLRPILGFMFAPVDKFSLGIAISKILVQGSNTSFQQAYRRDNIAIDNNPSHNSAVSLPDGQSSFGNKRKYPTQVSLGVAWFASQTLLVSGDINHFTAVNNENIKSVDNFALGAEYYLSKNWALRGGFYTNYANTPEITSADVNQNEHIDLYGGTLSFSHFTRNTSITLGGGYAAGSGKAQIISNSTGIQDATSKGWMIFLSSAYSY
jgi:long-chain fatty acid transport protein